MSDQQRQLAKAVERLELGREIYRRYLEDLIRDDESNTHGMAKSRLVSGMQVAMELAYQQGFERGCKAQRLENRREDSFR